MELLENTENLYNLFLAIEKIFFFYNSKIPLYLLLIKKGINDRIDVYLIENKEKTK